MPYAALVSVQLVFAGHAMLLHHELSGSVSVVAFAVYREVGAALCFIAAILAFEPQERWPQLRHARLFVQAGGSMGGQLTLTLIALKATSPAVVTLIAPTMPIFVALLAWCYWRDRLKRLQLGGMFLCIAGTYLLVSSNGSLGHVDVGAVIALLQSVVGANYLVTQKPLIRVGYTPLVVAGGSYAVALVLTSTIGLCYYVACRIEVREVQWWGSSPLYLVAVLYAILLMSVYNYITMAWVTQKMGPTVVALANLLQGWFTNIAEAAIFGRRLGVMEIIGALVLALGLVIFLIATPTRIDEAEASLARCHPLSDTHVPAMVHGPATVGSRE